MSNLTACQNFDAASAKCAAARAVYVPILAADRAQKATDAEYRAARKAYDAALVAFENAGYALHGV
jgi:hypothetical protein